MREKGVSRNVHNNEVSKLKRGGINKNKKGEGDTQINSPLHLKSQFKCHTVVTNLFHKRITGINLLCNIDVIPIKEAAIPWGG
jgi:hypothetical protein